MTEAQRAEAWERWGPQAVLGALVILVGLARAPSWGSHNLDVALTSVLVGAAVALGRRSPAAALTLAWSSGVVQVLLGTPVLTLQASLVVVAYSCARWGAAGTIWASGLSIPLGAGIAMIYLGADTLSILGRFGPSTSLIARRFPASTPTYGVVVMGLLAVPWLTGLVVRSTTRAQVSEFGRAEAQEQAAVAHRKTGQAQEIARLREEQARLARDVHDVVGHSLAVILAQAESAQYLPDDDPARLKQTLATIATSARGSLQDVRQVLSPTTSAATPPPAPDRFEQLLDGVRAGGHEVLATEVGAPRPLPPELDVVAHRVAQEMLTNAIKHGRRAAPVAVERHWPEGTWDRDLRIEVRNVEAHAPDETQPLRTDAPAPTPGQGLDGMRRRLESVGGRLDVRRRDDPDGATFTATAWVPVSGR